MNTKLFSWKIAAVIAVVLLVLLVWFKVKPGRHFTPEDKKDYVEKISWNILFQPGLSPSQQGKVISEIENDVRKFYSDYNKKYGTDFQPDFKKYWCPCDSALVNLDITCINGSTGSKSSTPPPTKPKSSGEFASVISISNNEFINESPEFADRFKPDDSLYTGLVAVDRSKLSETNAKILAIIDGGIQTDLFQQDIEKLIWRDLPGKPTLFNFLPGQKTGDPIDKGYVKHGSAVTAVAIQAMDAARKYPKIMVLKALDSADAGSVFSVSCALSYAVQKNAALVNLSLGYYGQPDSILSHYINFAASHRPFPVKLFVAAGNTIVPVHHTNDSITIVERNNNELTKSRLFYPGSFSRTFENVTTVTQLNWPDTACYYQNYSPEYVSLGVYGGRDNCCFFPVVFRQDNKVFYEGSSFATPIASGLRMVTLLNNDSQASADAAWNELIKHVQKHPVTKNGSYIIYNK